MTLDIAGNTPFLISILGGSSNDLPFAQELAQATRNRKVKFRVRTQNPVALVFMKCGHLIHCQAEAVEIPPAVKAVADRIYPPRHDFADVWYALSTSDAFIALPGGLEVFKQLVPDLVQARKGHGPAPVALVGMKEVEAAHFNALASQYAQAFDCARFNTGTALDTFCFLKVPSPTLIQI